MVAFKEKIYSEKFLVTSEIGPPKGIETKQILEETELVRGRVDATNVTDLQSSVMRLGSLAVCALLKQRGFEPIFQITCRDRNRLALQSDILSAAALGIENLLILTGDYPTMGDHPEAKPVFDLESVQLLQVIRRLQEGFDMKENKLEGIPPKFCLGAVVNPGADPLEPQILKMEKKIEAGAEFFQTQAIYDIKIFENFLSKTKNLKTKIFAGIVLLKSAGMAKYMNENVSGINVPQGVIEEMRDARDKVEKSTEIAARLIRQLKLCVKGFTLCPLDGIGICPSF